MFVVIYDLREMPANHQTFLRQRTFSVPVRREIKRTVNKENSHQTEERLLRYLIHLRFQSSKSGKIYLHRDVRLLFSRKSMEVDSGAAYELKSYTESPTNPQFSPRCQQTMANSSIHFTVEYSLQAKIGRDNSIKLSL